MNKQTFLVVNTLSTPLVYYTKSVDSREKSEELFMNGVEAYNKKDLQKGFDFFQAAIKADDKNVSAFNNLAAIITQYKNGQEGIDLFEQALKQFPKNPELRYNLGTIHLVSNNFKQAQLQLDQALSLSSNNFPIMNNLALSYSAAGLLNESKKILESIIEKDNTFLLAYHNLGHILYLEEKYDESLIYFKKAIEVKSSELSLNDAGCASYLLGDVDSAIRFFKEAIELNPEYRATYSNLGFLVYHEKLVKFDF